MKKIIYSSFTKFIAVVLLIASMVLGTLTVTKSVSDYFSEDELIYKFESSFSEARYFSHLFDAPESAIFNVYHNFYSTDNETVAFEDSVTEPFKESETEAENEASTNSEPKPLVDSDVTDSKIPITVNGETLEERLKKELDGLYCADKINYYVKLNDTVFTNCGAENEEEFMSAQFYRMTSRDEKGYVQIETSQSNYHWYPLLDELSFYEDTSAITICASVKDEYANECKEIWDRQFNAVTDAFKYGIIYVITILILIIYLLCVCGKNKDGELTSMWVDNIWTEIHLLAVGGAGVGAVWLCALLLDGYYNEYFTDGMIYTIVGVCAAIVSLIFITSTLSIVRNIKNKRFMKSCITVRVLCWSIKTVFGVLRWLRNKIISCRNLIFKTLSKITGVVLIGALLVYTVIIGIFGIFLPESPVWLILGILLFLFACFVVAIRVKDLEDIKKGAREIRGGNLGYKISEVKCHDMKALAENINDIGKGLDESVSAKVKAERMKTELITNVSHDLKTPITSIINYTELLTQVEGLPEEAVDYLSVISKKGERLKTLTEDLFDISKVQSGNEKVVFERLDVALLISQSLGEHDNEIKKSGLPFCVTVPKELCIRADGRKMSRVISNLINNILKYSMKNTRVFITASEKGGEVTMEFKNIASYPMDFTADEIVGRFVRGDVSRTMDGNGLGLAIAKSYTEICGGEFEVILDGDMFKAILRFKKDC